ncbi:N-ethylammeline chlorohydrolase [compost metagenome]
MCALLQKVNRLDGTCITAKDVYRMGTARAGEILRLPIGSLQTGMAADFVALNVHDLSLTPKTELFANMVYAMQPGAITHVVTNGKLIVDEGLLVNIAERQIVSRVDELFERLAGYVH